MRLLPLLLGLLLQAVQPSGSIEGFVVRAGTNPPQPLVNARLELTHASGVAVARTDNLGHFAFPGLPIGSFRLRVTKDGYIRQEYRQLALDKPGRPIVLAAAQQLKDIVFRMESAPTISGVIRDYSEARVPGAVVQAMKRVYDTRGNRTLVLAASTITDDRGVYRLYWLDPGEYVVSVTPPPLPRTPTNPKPVAYAPIYFPGSADLDYAKLIRLDVGADVHSMDFKFTRVSMGTLTGYVSSRINGAVVADVRVMPTEDGEGVARYGGRSAVGTGAYSLESIAPGSYIVSASTSTETAATRIRFTANDLRVDLRISEGVAVRGRVVNPASSMRIHLSEVDPSLPEPAVASIALNGEFVVSGVQPGNYLVRVDGLTGDQYLKSATYKSTDALERPMSVIDSAELEIQIGLDGGRVVGAVFDRGDKVLPNSEVILVPAGNRFRFDLYRTVITGDDGQFAIRGVAPGDYKLFAWENLEPNAYLNVDFMRPYEDSGTPVHVDANGNASVSLRVIPAVP